MSSVCAQRREALWSDCLVSPDVFNEMVERLGEFVMPYQQALETEANPHSMHLYLQGLLSQLPRKNAEEIAAWVDVERQVLQAVYLHTADKYHRLTRRPPWRPKRSMRESCHSILEVLSPLLTPSKPAVRTHVGCSGHLLLLFPTTTACSHTHWLRPRRHPKEQHFAEGPDVIRQSSRHRGCAGPPLFGRARAVGRDRQGQGLA